MRQAFFCSCNEGMGMMQPYCRAGGACCRSHGPQASGRECRLRFHKRHGFLRQACRTNLLQCVTFCEHGQLKGWKPHFQPTVAKSSISTHCNSMANGKNTFQYSLTNLGDHNSVTKPMLLYMRHKSGIFDKGMGCFASIMQA